MSRGLALGGLLVASPLRAQSLDGIGAQISATARTIDAGKLQVGLIVGSAVIALLAIWMLTRRPATPPAEDALELSEVYALPDLVSEAPAHRARDSRPRLLEAVAEIKAQQAILEAESDERSVGLGRG